MSGRVLRSARTIKKSTRAPKRRRRVQEDLHEEAQFVLRVREGFAELVRARVEELGLTWEECIPFITQTCLVRIKGTRGCFRKLKRLRVDGLVEIGLDANPELCTS